MNDSLLLHHDFPATPGAPLDLDLGRGVSMRFCPIPAGSFFMGQRGVRAEEEPVHRVIVPHPFWMAETPVTQEQYAVWKREHRNGFHGKPQHPAENMTWYDAVAFCQWLTSNCAAKIPPGYEAALPLEAEWEYACRARTRSEYHSGDGEAALKLAGWYDGNSDSSTHPVREKSANDWGLCDMHGNVWEWCCDAFDEHAYRKRPDGFVAERHQEETDQPRCLRGGSWFIHASLCRAAFRGRNHPGFRVGGFGFRVVLVPGPLKPSPDAEHPTRKQAGGGGGGGTTPETEPAGGGIHGRIWGSWRK